MGVKPYDSIIEYLQSSGSQYIDSGIECTSNLKVQFESMFFSTINAAICGGISNASGSTYFRHHFTTDTNNNFYYIQRSASSNASIRINASTNTWYNVIINPVKGTSIVNGVQYNFTALSHNYTTHQNYFIFARKAQSGAIQSKPSRFKSFKMWKNDILLREFIPVRKGEIGYMYDKVSGELFGNVGTGNFTLGPDI